MEEYFLLYWLPYRNNREVKFVKFKTIEEAKKDGNEKIRLGYDVVVIRKEITTNDTDSKEKYHLEKYGYYKVYSFINNIIFLFSTMLLVFFCYLYYKFFKLKK
jgi:hypothetical protein